jgi:hypothetical protein
MDWDFFWHSLGGGAILAAALTLARLIFDFVARGAEHRRQKEERHGAHQRDAEARLERVLQDRLAEADRRFERCEADLQSERVRSGRLEHDLLRTQQAFELLKVQYANLLQGEEAHRLPR